MRTKARLFGSCVALVLLVGVAQASAAAPHQIGSFGTEGTTGIAPGGTLNNPQGVAVDPISGDVYVAEKGSHRISRFTPFGEFVMTFGKNVVASGPDETGTGFEKCIAANGDVCQASTAYTGTFTGANGGFGFSNPLGIAFDSAGNLYVIDSGNRRVDKFDSAGNFVLTFGKDVNQTVAGTGAEICTAASGDTCKQATSTGAATTNGAFVSWPGTGSFIAVDPSDRVWVADKDRLQRFDTEGGYQATITAAEAGQPVSLSAAPSGRLFVVWQTAPGVREMNATGTVLRTYKGPGMPRATAARLAGGLYLGEEDESDYRIRDYDEEGNLNAAFGTGVIGDQSTAGLATNADGTLYAADSMDGRVAIFGPVPSSYGSPPAVAPTVGVAQANNIGERSVQIEGAVDAHFLATTYWVEVGTADCSVNPCAQHPLAPGKPLLPVSGLPETALATIAGLQPGSTYHYRVMAESSAGLTAGADHVFVTDTPGAGQSHSLPDGRAYELVSPTQKNGYEVFPVGTTQTSLSGDAVTFASYGPFAGAPVGVQPVSYAGTRSSAGWTTSSISPPMETGGEMLAPGGNVRYVSPDLSKAVVRVKRPALAPEAPVGVPNLYLRDNSTGSYELITTAVPPVIPTGYEPVFAGATPDMSRILFQAQGNLIPGSGAPEEAVNLYEWHDGQLALVSTAPPASGGSVAGGGAGTAGSGASYRPIDGAISDDGSRIFFTVNGGKTPADGINEAQGQLWMNEDGGLTHVSATQATSETFAEEHAVFEAAASDGSKVLFRSRSHLTDDANPGTANIAAGGVEDLYMYDVVSGVLTDITPESIDPSGQAGVNGVGAASEDLSYVYFAACGQLIAGKGRTCAENEVNAFENTANLYLFHDGSLRFIAVISMSDPDGSNYWNALASAAPLAQGGLARGGAQLTFTSNRQLAAYDNAGLATVYVYDADTELIECVSCNPSGAAPVGDAELASEMVIPGLNVATGSHYTPNSVSTDGSRAFFTSRDRLVPQDRNHVRDVYEWEEGELHLLSSGQSADDSLLAEVSPSGEDVFMYTTQGLVPQDTDGLYDIYDVRVGGGFPEDAAQAPACTGSACRGAITAGPPPPPPASSALRGKGNVRPERPRRCPKGKRRVSRAGKARCVQKRRHVNRPSRSSKSRG